MFIHSFCSLSIGEMFYKCSFNTLHESIYRWQWRSMRRSRRDIIIIKLNKKKTIPHQSFQSKRLLTFFTFAWPLHSRMAISFFYSVFVLFVLFSLTLFLHLCYNVTLHTLTLSWLSQSRFVFVFVKREESLSCMSTLFFLQIFFLLDLDIFSYNNTTHTYTSFQWRN